MSDGRGEPPEAEEPLADTANQVVRGVLRSLGVDEDELHQAEAEGRLLLLGIERMMLVDEARYDIETTAQRTGLTIERTRQIWRSLGFADPEPGELVFNDLDVRNLSAVSELIASGAVAPEVALQVTRVLGGSTARIAESLIDAVVARHLYVAEAGGDVDDRVVAEAASFLPQFPAVLEHVWRRHLQAAARRRLVRVVEGDAAQDLVVGFADLVRFTSLAQELSDAELAELVTFFEECAYDVVVAGGGRVVKMIGDEVMFLIDEPSAAAEIALGLADASRDAEELPDVRVGLAMGPVLERDGDAYGSTVNLASRITAIAHPGTVVVAKEIRTALEGDPSFEFRTLRGRTLRHIGRVSLSVLRRADESASTLRDAIDERRRQMTGSLRDRLKALGLSGDEEDDADGD